MANLTIKDKRTWESPVAHALWHFLQENEDRISQEDLLPAMSTVLTVELIHLNIIADKGRARLLELEEAQQQKREEEIETEVQRRLQEAKGE